MSDTLPPPAVPTAPADDTAPRKRGYFNQDQLEDLELAETVLAAARAHPAEMAEQDVTEDWLTSFAAALAEARRRATDAGQQGGASKQATAAARAAAADLHAGLKRIQSSAKQKHQMLAEDGDPATNFPIDGYLIGTRLDANRASLLQNAATLIQRAKADSLPGFKTPAKLQELDALLAAYTATEDDQQETNEGKELARIDRDTLLNSINRRRAAIQHAADALWPPTQEPNRPIRKTFKIPANRAMGL